MKRRIASATKRTHPNSPRPKRSPPLPATGRLPPLRCGRSGRCSAIIDSSLRSNGSVTEVPGNHKVADEAFPPATGVELGKNAGNGRERIEKEGWRGE